MGTQRPRVAVWKANSLQVQRRKRIGRISALAGISALVLIVTVVLGIKQGWGFVLDWAVVTIPSILGFAAWVIPVKETQAKHKWLLFVGGLAFSGLIWYQQYLTRKAHASEMANLATKDDIKKVPTAEEIVKELRKCEARESSKEPGKPGESKSEHMEAVPSYPSTKPSGQDTGPEVSKELGDIKNLLQQQHWGLNAEQLLALSRKMAPFAKLEERGDLITCVLGDPDSTRFATSLVAVFRAAGWKLPGSGFNQAVFSGTVEGVIIQLHSKEDKAFGLLEFVTSLREAGITPVGQIDDSVPSGEFRIVIGRRPT